MQQQRSTMPGIANLNFAVRGCFSTDKRRIVGSHRVFREQLIGTLDKFADTKPRHDQTAKDRVQPRHQK